MRGFVVTLATIGIIVLLVTLAGLLRNSYLGMERALEEPQALAYGAALFDDVGEDVNAIAGPGISISQGNGSTVLAISDTLPPRNFTSELSAYEAFLENRTAAVTQAYVDANFSNMSSGRVLLRINGRYEYGNDPEAGEMRFGAISGDTNASSYVIDIVVPEVRAAYAPFEFNSSGDVNVTLRYLDMNGTISEFGALRSGQANEMRIDYDGGGSLLLEIGPKGGHGGSLWMKATGANASVAWSAVLPRAGADDCIGYAYDATLEYRLGKMGISRGIGK